MSATQPAPDRLQEYADCVAKGDYEGAKTASQALADMDCSVCTRIGAALGGLALAAEATINDEVERELCRMALSRADVLAEDLREPV
jgi:hypothetical protein